MGFLQTFQHLLPRAKAWTLTTEKKLRSFFEGLSGAPEDAQAFLDDVHDDLYPASTRALGDWERQFGLPGAAAPEITEADRRARLDARWKALGGQAPRYLQDAVQAAGFPLFVHEWWVSGPPYVARDPRSFTIQPTIGTIQCGEPLALCGQNRALANAFLANFPQYYVNLDLTLRPPPPIPDAPSTWPYFVYFGDETLSALVDIPVERRAELEDLLLSLCPTHLWIVLMVRWVEFSNSRITLQGATRVTLQANTRVTLGT